MYPIIPIVFRRLASAETDESSSSSTDEPNLSKKDAKKTARRTRQLAEKVLGALELDGGRANNLNGPIQTAEIVQKLRQCLEEGGSVNIRQRKVSKTAHTYIPILKKVRRWNDTRTAGRLGSSCGIVVYAQIDLFVIVDSCGEAEGIFEGDVILNTMVNESSVPTPFPFQQQQQQQQHQQIEPVVVQELDILNPQPLFPKTQQQIGIYFVLPLDSYCVPEIMEMALGQFVQISLMPLCAPACRKITSNYWGGLAPVDGIVVTDEIYQDICTGGRIAGNILAQTGVELAVEEYSGGADEAVADAGLKIIASISW